MACPGPHYVAVPVAGAVPPLPLDRFTARLYGKNKVTGIVGRLVGGRLRPRARGGIEGYYCSVDPAALVTVVALKLVAVLCKGQIPEVGIPYTGELARP